MNQENINIPSYSLSFCITCYDRDYHLILQAINQLTSQSRLPNEIIISSSGLLYSQLVHPKSLYINNYNIPIISINNNNRKLPGYARNAAYYASNCDLIMFFDIDDILHPQKIEIVNSIFDLYNCDMVVHNYTLGQFVGFDEYSDIGNVCKIIEKDKNSTNLISVGGIHHGHITIKKSILQYIRYNENRALGEDGQFCQEVFDNNYNIYYCGHPLIHYNTR